LRTIDTAFCTPYDSSPLSQ